MTDDELSRDAEAALDRAAERATRMRGIMEQDRTRRPRRLANAVRLFVLAVFLLPAELLAVGHVTFWFIAHLVVIAGLAARVARLWTEQHFRVQQAAPNRPQPTS